ncbi:MAG: hypothetical protein CMH39_00425 [Micrococcales bacterium]|jgi:hypothetical protein|nr:hypothetical protein [Micrococcales bacterium]|tara:strand:+ start:228 stop:428 length:201 start_codon:yes stop_codon:yes gene_type:complete
MSAVYKTTIYLRSGQLLKCVAGEDPLRAFQVGVGAGHVLAKLVGTCGTSFVVRPEAVDAIEAEPVE